MQREFIIPLTSCEKREISNEQNNYYSTTSVTGKWKSVSELVDLSVEIIHLVLPSFVHVFMVQKKKKSENISKIFVIGYTGGNS